MQPYSCQLFPDWELFIPTLGTKYSQTGNNHERIPVKPPPSQQRVACGKDHHLPQGKRRSRQKDRRQPLTEG